MFWPFNIRFSQKKLSMICFDLDNTLCDYASAEAETEVHMINMLHNDLSKSRIFNKSHDISRIVLLKMFNNIKNHHLESDMDPKGFSRKLWFDELAKAISAEPFMKNAKKNLPKMLGRSEHYEKEYWKYFNSIAKLYSNTLYSLDYLKSMGLKLAMVTNSDGIQNIKLNRIKHLGIDKYFDYVLTSDDSGANKPDIKNWEMIIKISGLNPKECMMVGDHPDIDLANAKKLGFITVWTKQHLNFDLHHDYVDYEIRDIQEILNIVKNYSIVRQEEDAIAAK